MTYFFALFFGLLIFCDFHYSNHRVTPFCAIAIPYVVIVFINNTYATRFVFFPIDDNVIMMIGFSLVCFYVGQLFVWLSSSFRHRVIETESTNYLRGYDINKIFLFCKVMSFVAIFWSIYLICIFGVSYLDRNEGFAMTGPIAHCILATEVLLPLLFCKWLENKKDIKYLVVIVPFVLVIFLSFIKYNIIGMFIYFFLVAVSVKKQRLYGAGLLIVVAVFILFSLNYFISAIANGYDFPIRFYLQHFWKYVAGSCINDGYAFTNNLATLDMEKLIFNCVMSFPNMFLQKFFDFEFAFEMPVFGEWEVADGIGETANIKDFFGSFFPFNGEIVEYVIYSVFVCLFGFFCGFLYLKYVTNINRLYLPESSPKLCVISPRAICS